MSQRLSYVKFDERATDQICTLKQKFEEIEKILARHSEGRYKALALTAIEEAYAWCGKMIRDEQIGRTGKIEDVNERGDL
jgi:uncharacterized protein YutE (UPF0331/DUF86 family)